MNLQNAPVAANLPAVDLERAKKFYGEMLGLKEMEGHPGMALFEAGSGSMIMLYAREATKADHTAASFEVSDVVDTVKALREKGVKFEDYPDMGTVDGVATEGSSKVAWFKDTEGNILCLHQG